jgi:hypothetical protein
MVLEEDFNGVTDIASWVSEEFFFPLGSQLHYLYRRIRVVDCETGPLKKGVCETDYRR